MTSSSLPTIPTTFVLLDPPYSNEESETLYGTPPLRYGAYTAEAVRVCRPGGYVAVYHVKQAARPVGCRLVHRIVVLTRTWHAARICMVFVKETDDELAARALASQAQQSLLTEIG